MVLNLIYQQFLLSSSVEVGSNDSNDSNDYCFLISEHIYIFFMFIISSF
jgi:hypothetical protein